MWMEHMELGLRETIDSPLFAEGSRVLLNESSRSFREVQVVLPRVLGLHINTTRVAQNYFFG